MARPWSPAVSVRSNNGLFPTASKENEWQIPTITSTWYQQVDIAPDGRHAAIGRTDGRILILRLTAPK